jgi:hypothetical protein
MLRTTVFNTVGEVPDTWVFEYYLNIESLAGQEVKIKSVFNPKDKIPSMVIYYNHSKKRYQFKDFSTGKYGDRTDLVAAMFNLSLIDAANKIVFDYKTYKERNDYSIATVQKHDKYKVTEHKMRKWTTQDAHYWTRFNIGSKKLEYYNVAPLTSYDMEKEIDSQTAKKISITGPHLYGYFRSDGTLCKIYQPMIENKKFIKCTNYIQGMDQLRFEKPHLVILSSLKDLMSFDTIGFQSMEYIAPDSENSMIPESTMRMLLKKYNGCCTIFDNDTAGALAIERYKTRYGIPGFALDMMKDISDSIEKHRVTKVREALIPLLEHNLKFNQTWRETSTLV